MSEERLLVTGYWLLVLLSTNNQQPTTNNLSGAIRESTKT